ncbi:protein RMD5 homolog A-like [Mizuhopecten yessoensis]|uniref:Protein RMD5-like A n=1 Tax=Mizuhopecten yessoensis TaxID=6573 RepID=A0A210Q5D8_MIZYE|nr:protein RMD5 homolog A-like [Mizuhopecten yessoensis]OWF43962.1 Protein RMD5-like A [Mizuhopecten yessoensis]
MESCNAVEREVEKVFNKFAGLKDHSTKNLDELCNSIQSIQRELGDGETLTATQTLILTQTVRRIKEAVSRLGQEHKELHSTVSKVGKSIDRNFVNDLTSIATDGAFEGTEKTHLLNEVVCEHFMRQGMLDIADALVAEANLEIAGEKKEPFLELHRILGALKQKNLEPALCWATSNKDRLREINSCLEFKLHRLKFIDLLRQGHMSQTEALYYSRHLSQFASQYPRDLQVLMGSMLYLRQGIENSPYAHLVAPIYWEEICDVFTRDACCLLGMSVESPLSVSIRAGCLALPPLLNIRQVMQQRQVSGVWSNKDELPVEIDLGKDYRYHSTFACPILRQQTTDTNPPMRLICGHVISKDALTKLSNGTKVKCPYCPIEQLPMEAKQIYF